MSLPYNFGIFGVGRVLRDAGYIFWDGEDWDVADSFIGLDVKAVDNYIVGWAMERVEVFTGHERQRWALQRLKERGASDEAIFQFRLLVAEYGRTEAYRIVAMERRY